MENHDLLIISNIFRFVFVKSIKLLTPVVKILSRDGQIRAIRTPRSIARFRDSGFSKFPPPSYISQKHPQVENQDLPTYSDSSRRFVFLVKSIKILTPAIKILSRDGQIRAIRTPRSIARFRDSGFSKIQPTSYIFQKVYPSWHSIVVVA